MDQPAAPRRRFRFGLRTLLIVVTLAAVGSWAYWIGWPWWQIYHERVQFEAAARQLKAGISTGAAIASLPTHKPLTMYAETQGHAVALTDYTFRESIYCIYYAFRPGPQSGAMQKWACDSLEVFRLPRMPNNFQLNSKNRSLWQFGNSPLNEEQYCAAFLTFISGDRKENPGFQYELIYADPPAKAVAK
jgi:hypothetical protein